MHNRKSAIASAHIAERTIERGFSERRVKRLPAAAAQGAEVLGVELKVVVEGEVLRKVRRVLLRPASLLEGAANPRDEREEASERL